ncbi:M48 family metallopeptidase [Glaciimonas soli]|uniref:M48 family metalloprotease n=1 Tax=Glaciimonas soli TaxID=2590999 RepID=A0A843YUS3_9BURK|nr:M48 family metallopeptidase [Glaciimonas soli]MQR01747.1 M48 family metalloprotease [Glaciimonas soli]
MTQKLNVKLGFKRCAIVLPLIFLAACATQEPGKNITGPAVTRLVPRQSAPINPQQAELKALIAQQNRLYTVAAPLLVNNAELCRNNARNLLGFTAKTKYSFSPELVDAASALGLSDQLQVTGVLAGSGAEQAGIKSGDLLATIQGKPVPQGENAERQAAMMLGPLVNRHELIKLGLIRKGQNLTIDVPLTRACAFGIELGNTKNVNSFADGRRVLVTAGMMNFIQNDDELALVIAREMAHNTLTHPVKQRMTGTMSGIIDNLIRVHPDTDALAGSAGVKPYPAQLDVAADKLSLYMVARAGYSVDTAAIFWQRLATQYPATIPNGHTAIHPAVAARIDMIQKTVAEINAKQAAGVTLTP